MLYHKTYHCETSQEWVIFLHGAGGSSSVWFKQIRDFSKHYNVLLIDLRGHGKSNKNENHSKLSRYSFLEVTKDVIEVMDQVGVKEGHFIGLSLGTVIIRLMAEIERGRVKSMIMGGAITNLDFRTRSLFIFGNIIKKVIPNMWLYRLFAWIVMPNRNHSESRNIFIQEAKKACHREFTKWYRLMAVDMNPLLQNLYKKTIDLPTMFIMGEEDHLFLPQVRKLVKHHRNFLIKVIQGSGHVCNVDTAEEFNRRCLEFLNRFTNQEQTPVLV